MATMNKSRRYNPAPETNPVKNHEGTTVHELAPLEVLFSKVLGSFFGESTFYEKRTAEKDYKELVKTIKQIPYSDREYALKIAQLGRMHNMIQYPLEILSVCFNLDQYKGENFLDDENRSLFHKYVPRLVLRAKDLTELVSTQIAMYGFAPKQTTVRGKRKPVVKRDRPLPTAMRKTLTEVLQNFDEYKLSKGLGDNKDVGEVTSVNKTVVTLADVIKLLRPKPKSRHMSNVYKAILEGKLEFGAGKKTFQSVNVSVGKGEATKKDLVKTLDTETVFGIVKNLVSLYRNGVLNDKEAVLKIVDTLTDSKKIKASKMLPFRFYSAWKEMGAFSGYGAYAVRDALVEALDLSIENLDVIEGFNAILIDTSGSMRYPVSGDSTITAKDIALILGAIIYKQGIGDVYLFANSCQRVTGLSTRSTVIDLVEKFNRVDVGGGTYINVALDEVTRNAMRGDKYDNLIILSDNDCYGYDEHRNVLSFKTMGGYGYSHGSSEYGSVDRQLSEMLRTRVIKRLWINNLLGNKFALANTDDYRKNLITGFSEKFVNIINVYNGLGMNKDIRRVIDAMLGER